MFDLQLTSKGRLVELRPRRPADYDDLYAVAIDPLIWEQHPVRNRHKQSVFREFFAEALARRDGGGRDSCLYKITAATFHRRDGAERARHR